VTPLQVSLLLGLLARAAADAAPAPTCINASLDRVEAGAYEGDASMAVLDVPNYPAMNVPGVLANGIPEGVPVRLCAQVSGKYPTILEIYLTRDPDREEEYRRDLRDHYKQEKP